jgi:hypothetical protein
MFKEIVNESLFLTELNARNDENIKNAINNVLRVKITYDDRKDKTISNSKGKKTRYILPVAYGLTKNGKRAIRAYQTAGSTKRGVPKWKLFLLDNIISWTNGNKSFKKYGDSLIKLGLNTNGDKHMTTLYAITPIGGGGTPVAKSSKPIDTEPITKIDINPKTNIVQTPTIINKTKDFEIPKINNTVDNLPQKTYVNNKVNISDTEPVKKDEINPENNNDGPNSPNLTTKTEPISKDDINSETEKDISINSDNKLTNSFNDLMKRMNVLNNDEEEK